MAIFNHFPDALNAFRETGGCMLYHHISSGNLLPAWEVDSFDVLADRLPCSPRDATSFALTAGGFKKEDIETELSGWPDVAPEDDRITEQDVERALERKGMWKASRIVISKNREEAFVLIGDRWQRMDLTDSWWPHDPVPGYIPADSIEQFYDWIEKDRERENRKGRKTGENAMGAAIRGLIGAAALVDLERSNEDW